jgi:hypothetical protein
MQVFAAAPLAHWRATAQSRTTIAPKKSSQSLLLTENVRILRRCLIQKSKNKSKVGSHECELVHGRCPRPMIAIVAWRTTHVQSQQRY